MHDASKVLLAVPLSSDRELTCEDADPATYLAGLVVRRPSGGGLSLSSGQAIGVSMGKDLADTAKTSVCRVGNRVPLQITDEGAYAELEKADLTFTAKAKGTGGNSITIAFTDTETAGSESVTVDGNDIVVEMEDGVSTATQCKAALDASEDAMALIGVAISGTAGDPQDAFAEDALEGGLAQFPYVVPGGVVKVATTGKATSDGALVTGAIYVSGALTGIKEDGTETDAALIDMGGGL